MSEKIEGGITGKGFKKGQLCKRKGTPKYSLSSLI
jgi:hypothetical protein